MDQTTTIPPFSPHADGDHLAAALLRALGRSHRNHFSMGPARIGILGWLTLGLVPLWKLSRQFRDAVTLERQQLLHAAEWIRLRTGTQEATDLEAAAKRIKFDAGVSSLSKWFALTFVAVALFTLPRMAVGTLINSTYGFHRTHSATDLPVFLAWNVGVGAAYLMHRRQVRSHMSHVAHFVERYNAVARREVAPMIPIPHAPGAVEIRWAIPAFLLCAIGAWWSIPMMMAGAEQRRYVNAVGQDLRLGLLLSVQSMVALRQSAAAPNIVIQSRRCENDLCRAPLRANASYCSRCGHRAGAAASTVMSEVA